MSEPRRVLVVGATGLVGTEVLRRADAAPGLRFVALSRREPAATGGGAAEAIIAPSSRWLRAIVELAPDAVICALGTTWRKAGRSEAEFRAVDQDLVLAVAQAARNAGARRFVLVSSVGASPRARSFYLRVKGEVEAALADLGFERLDILRPGLLRGVRGGERRLGERAAILVSPLADLLLRGRLRRYRSIAAGSVAAAALQCLHEKPPGRFAHENAAILRLATCLRGES